MKASRQPVAGAFAGRRSITMNELLAAIAAFENAPIRPINGRLVLTKKVRALAQAADMPKPLPANVRRGVNAARAFIREHGQPIL
ncbi:hypothetical protein [Azospirillum argentinense]